MATILSAQPLRWALDLAERDGLQGEAAMLRALEVVLAENGGESVLKVVREALGGYKPGFSVSDEAMAQARKVVACLDGLSHGERLLMIRRSRKALRGIEVCEALLERTRDALPADAASSGSWAECALRVIRWTSVSEPREVAHAFSLEARAWAFWANSYRVACDLRTAERLLAQAIGTIDCQAVMDLETRAEVMEIAARVQRARRQTTEATSNLRWAVAVWEVLDRKPEFCRALVALATALEASGEVAGALSVAREALQVADQIDAQRLKLTLTHMEALYLEDLGRVREAEEALERAKVLAIPFQDSFTQLRMRWIEGRLARSNGEMENAVGILRNAQSGFIAQQNPYVAALVSLDLTVIHLEAGRYSEAAELARAMAATFDALGVQREAWAACRLFADACERHQASVAVAKNLARYLDQARQDPEYGFPASAMFG